MIEILGCFLDVFLLSILANLMYGLKVSKVSFGFLFALGWFLDFFLSLLIPIPEILDLILNLIFIIYCFIGFTRSLSSALVLQVFYSTLSIISGVLVLLIEWIFKFDFYNDFLISVLLTGLMRSILIFIFIKNIRSYIRILSDSMWLELQKQVLLPLLLINFVFNGYFYTSNPNYWLIMVLTLIFALLVIRSFFKQTFLTVRLIEMEQIQKVEEIGQAYQVQKEIAEEQLRYLHHDFKNHINILSHLAEKKEYERLCAYIDKLTENSYQIDHKVYSDCEEINVIINQKVKTNPKIHFEISVTGSILDSMVQTVCIIVFNVLDNAIHEIDSYPSEKKRIALRIRNVSEFLIIECENPIETQSTLALSSSKPKGSGLGLSIVNMLVERNNGFVQIRHSNDLFLIKVLLRKNEEKRSQSLE